MKQGCHYTRIAVKKNGKITKEIPILDLKRVIIIGNSHLASKGIEVAFLSSSLRFRFRIVPQTSKNIFLRIAQHERYQDKNFRLRISRIFIKTKLKNQRSFLVRYQRNQPDVNLEKYIKLLLNCALKVDNKESIEGLMGIEGSGARGFFEAYGKLIRKEFEFKKRQYHPPPDPVNAMLSFGYMLLFNELSGLLEACGFDIFIGFLHSINYGRASLANDLMEELRSPIIDRLVLYLINKRIIKKTAFKSCSKGVLMEDSARNSFLANYENFMTARFLDVRTKKSTNYRTILHQRVHEIEKTVLNNYDYKPFVLYT